MHILLVRLRMIGDVVFTTPLIRGLVRQYPDARLTYVVEPAALPVVVHNPHLTSIVTIPAGRGVNRIGIDLSTGLALRRSKFDVAIDLHGGPRSAWLTWLSGARRRIGYRTPGRTWMYTDVVERSPDNGPRHSVRNQWDLLAPLEIEPCDPTDDPVEMFEDIAAARRVEQRLAAATSAASALVVIHVSAGNPFRRWPGASFVELVEQLARHDPARRIILTSGPSEATAARRIAAEARQRLDGLSQAVPEIEDFDLHELRSLIARADLFIGGDSGPLHIAATTRTPVVALLGPTLPERSMPWRPADLFAEHIDAGPLPCRPCRQRTCAPGDFRCLTRITPAQVAAAAERALNVRSKHHTPEAC